MNMNDKITRHHLDRAAYIYVRQSTGHQVRHHHQGRQRQYDLSDRANELGFKRVVVIDDDQGKTGSGLVERPGFATLLAAVCSGEAGAVFALEASRLARNNRDWHHLIDLCALTGTLIIDGEGVYDSREVNDRLLLGLKGTMSEFELSLFRQRARGAFEMKVAAGHAMWEMPIGFTRDELDRVEKIADRQVQAAIDGVFRKVRELGSARQTALWYRDNNVPLPEAIRGTRSKQVVWRLPTETRIRQILKNPCYAGALAYGRTETKITIEEGRARKSGSRNRKPQEKWKVLIQNNHVGYIKWQDYLENLSMLESNAASREPSGSGVAKKGAALLGGLLRCGHCGRKMFVAYSGKGRGQPRYLCHGGREARGSASCQSLGGASIDRAVVDVVLEAIAPAGIEAALEAMKQFDNQQDEQRCSLELSFEKARFEVDRARRQYDQVDPANRLVASELEARWNAAIEHAVAMEQQLEQLAQQRVELTDDEQVRLLELGRDLPALWQHASATADMKKRILRTVLEEIVIGDDESHKNHLLALHWKGGVHTELSVVRNAPGKKYCDTSKTALELIEELSKVCSDQTIAATLNRLGYKTGAGKTWRLHSVHNARYIHRLTNHRKANAWVTVEQASRELGVSHTVVRRLIREGTLPAKQVVETTAWIIDRQSLTLPAVESAIAAVRNGRQLPSGNEEQAEFPFK
jgi:DNA invertase Pin-like site-specific DNA recombinase